MLELYELLKDKVVWEEKNHRHMLGKTVLTNKDMHKMCIEFYKLEYECLSKSMQRKIREEIFYKLRYGKYKNDR